MNRRNFLAALLGAAAGAAYDPERALWVPGKKLISIPAPRSRNVFVSHDVFIADFMRILNRNLSLQAEVIGLALHPPWTVVRRHMPPDLLDRPWKTQ